MSSNPNKIISLQELINAQVDAYKLELIMNEAPWVEVTTRLGRKCYSIATIQGIIDQYKLLTDQELDNLKNAIEVAAASGAGANGWTDKLVQTWSGRTQESKNKDVVSFKDYLLLFVNPSEALKAASIASNGGVVKVPNGTYTFNGTVDGVSACLIDCDNAEFIFTNIKDQDGIVFKPYEKLDVKMGVIGATIRPSGANGRYAVAMEQDVFGQTNRTQVHYEKLAFACNTAETASEESPQKVDFSWKYHFLLADAKQIYMNDIKAVGCYDYAVAPEAQFLDGFIRCAPIRAIANLNLNNIATHNVAKFFGIVRRTFFNLNNIDVAQGYLGIYDEPDREFETNVFSYAESFWDNVGLACSYRSIDLSNRYNTTIGKIFIHSVDAVGIDQNSKINAIFKNSIVTNIQDLSITSSGTGIVFDSGYCNHIDTLKGGVTSILLQAGVAGNSATQALSINEIQLFNNVSTVINNANSRQLSIKGFTKSSIHGFAAFITHGDANSKASSILSNCPTDHASYSTGLNLNIVYDGSNRSAVWGEVLSNINHNFATYDTSRNFVMNYDVITKDSTTNRVLTRSLRADNNIDVESPQLRTRRVQPLSDNTDSIGLPEYRYSTIYASSGAINTSDERLKQQFRPLKDIEKECALEIKGSICLFKFNDMVDLKGDGARWHTGVKAQEVVSIMQNYGLNPFDYGFVCFDEWNEQEEIIESWADEYAQEDQYDDSGELIYKKGHLIRKAGSQIIQEYRKGGSRYAIRYDELAMFILTSI